ncbi:hypothetical protein E2562_031960 [Oryza meyeriana var. granulata]|uniref:Uncharacterized protein n=1 Tax=Oryza meyeriana var. granulata TaxID=110450 RepID=A0A6G1ERU8_9ORYZ|nr:hypothetical protein E2562_031960 [Oryza meyeriana var. granulata]
MAHRVAALSGGENMQGTTVAGEKEEWLRGGGGSLEEASTGDGRDSTERKLTIAHGDTWSRVAATKTGQQ